MRRLSTPPGSAGRYSRMGSSGNHSLLEASMTQPISSGKPESGWEPTESRSIKTTIKYIVDVLIADDGVGGADPRRGSGLMGPKDRVEALGGTIRLVSPRGGGTSVDAAMPVDNPRAACASAR
jgi:hypothetical protein